MKRSIKFKAVIKNGRATTATEEKIVITKGEARLLLNKLNRRPDLDGVETRLHSMLVEAFKIDGWKTIVIHKKS